MRIYKEKELYICEQKLPDGSITKGSGLTMQNALAWCMWGVKMYFNRLRRQEAQPIKAFALLRRIAHRA